MNLNFTVVPIEFKAVTLDLTTMNLRLGNLDLTAVKLNFEAVTLDFKTEALNFHCCKRWLGNGYTQLYCRDRLAWNSDPWIYSYES